MRTRINDRAPTTTDGPGWIDRTYRWLINHSYFIIMVITLLVLVVTVGFRIYLVLAYIPDLGGVESNVIYSIQRLLDGYPLYTHPAEPPYAITQYPPAYYYVCWAAGKLFRVDPGDVYHVYVLSRSVSLVFNLLLSGVVARILIARFNVNRFVAAVGFAYALVYLDHESFSRPDSLYHLLFMLTVGVFLSALETPCDQSRPRWVVGASFLSVLTIFAKQSGIYLPLLLLFFLVFYVNHLRYALIALVTITVSFILLLLLSSAGGAMTFLQNTWSGVNNGVSVPWFLERIAEEHFLKEQVVNIFGLFFGIYYLARGRSTSLKFMGLAILGSFSFALVTSVKVGAAPNYFTEFILLTIIAGIHFAVARLPEKPPARTADTYLPLLYLLILLFTLLPRLGGKLSAKLSDEVAYGQVGYLRDRAVAEYLYRQENIQPTDQVLVTSHKDDYLNKFLYRNVIFPQKEIVIANPPDAYDYTEFRKALEAGTVDYVVARRPPQTKREENETVLDFNFIGADFSDFTLVHERPGYAIFRHRRAK